MPAQPPAAKRILAVARLPIGDTLFLTPALHALRVAYPHATLTALVYPSNGGILHNNPDVDHLLYWPTQAQGLNPGGLLRLAADLRGHDLSVEFSAYQSYLSAWAGARVQGHLHLPAGWWIDPRAGREWRRLHAVRVYAAVVERLGIPIPDWHLRIYPTAEEKERAAALLAHHGIEFGEPVIGIHAGGEGLWGRKQWGPQRFSALADGLHAAMGGKIVVLGGTAEAGQAAAVARRATAPVFNLAGQTTLGETAALAATCRLFIGNDSSPLHIASAVGTPVVGIYGPTSPRSYHPWRPGARAGRDYAIVLGRGRCAGRFTLGGGQPLLAFVRAALCRSIHTVTPEQVLKAALGLLNQT